MTPPASYDSHGLLTIVSDVALPELAAFRTAGPVYDPTIRVRIGRMDEAASRQPPRGSRTVTYIERLGELGFAIRITLGDRVELVASSLLGCSPHVLYTNAVEPVLRWAFVERGYALVHGACLSVGDQAFLITARTDTGKTTTVLKTLDAHPDYAFLSDDLTLLRSDGTVLSYPKPLTISTHTLNAVNTPLLTPLERLALIFQSRLHSKSGRWLGQFLTRFQLPMATTNAIVQCLVPPPKYPVERLVPHATMASHAQLAGMVAIERGRSYHSDLNPREAVDLLLANCEDSYGFPPYHAIKEHLYRTRTGDLRVKERQILTSALARCPATMMRSESRNWFQDLPEFINGVQHRARTWRMTEIVGVPAASD